MIKDFVKIKDISKELLKKYEGELPSDVLKIWNEYGLGTFYNGYLKVINPEEYKEVLEYSYFRGDVSIPVFATAFGDMIIWQENQYVGIVKYRYGVSNIIYDGFEYFIEDVLEGFLDGKHLSIRQYNAAIKKYGVLEYDECFGYIPLLALGGKESVNNLKKVKIREHIALITEMAGEV